MKNRDIKKLSEILSFEKFKFSKLSNETRIKLVRIQIVVDPISEELGKAREKASKQFTTPRFEELNSKVANHQLNIPSAEADEYIKLSKEFNENMGKTLDPVFDEDRKIVFGKLTLEEYGKVIDANEDWLTGDMPKTLFMHIVDDKPEKEPKKKEE